MEDPEFVYGNQTALCERGSCNAVLRRCHLVQIGVTCTKNIDQILRLKQYLLTEVQKNPIRDCFKDLVQAVPLVIQQASPADENSFNVSIYIAALRYKAALLFCWLSLCRSSAVST